CRQRMPGDEQAESGDPLLEAEADRRGKRAIEDGDSARRAAEQDRLGQRAMDGDFEAIDVASSIHQTSAPPPKEKKERKKLDAAKAMDRPKTIWISRRKPPEVSPKASVKPVMMMMITATILATGPWTDSRMRWSGSSHGMPEPAA